MNFSELDILQIQEKGLTTEEVERQIEVFKRGNIKVDIKEAATVGKGIFSFTDSDKKELTSHYQKKKNSLELLKFVPASGAATRMFKALHLFIEEFDPEKDSVRKYLDKKQDDALQRFFEKIEKLPFYGNAVELAREEHHDFDELNHNKRLYFLVKYMVYTPGLGLSDLPKGLVPFHKYPNYTATAFEEHLHEAAEYIADNGVAKLHFTVAEGDKEKFEAEYEQIRDRVESQTNTQFDITYSYQDPKTDTIAVDENYAPFRDEDGKLFFRPGGHGALIENLNRQKADVVFIKNIDNVVINSDLPWVVENKRILAGKLLQLQEQCFGFLKSLDSDISEDKTAKIARFLEEEIFTPASEGFGSMSLEDKKQYLKDKLDRPLRVCGMVKNEGEPGGGPFLVRDENGEISLQIIEGAQIDKENPQQVKTAREATHFNPVDIVCGLRNYKGEPYDLNKYVDSRMSFIADKTKDGKPLKALERPGLWNGGMAKWNTVFVEVPVETFNPVKTVADLVKPSHQPGR